MAFFSSDREMESGTTIIRINRDRLIMAASQHAAMDIIREEIQSALTNDPELRILVREMVKESIAKMNLQEVVNAAVKASLKTE